MRKICVALFLGLLAANTSIAHHNQCAETRAAQGIHAKGTIASPLENDYDVKVVKIDLAMTNTSTAISGNATSKVLVTAATGLSQYSFELDTALTIDSMKIDGIAVAPVTSGGSLRIVTLASTVPQGLQITAQVWYHGTPPNGTGFFTHGLNHYTLSTGTNITFSLSDPYLAKDWWPCKQSLGDKIESAVIWLTVPAGLKAGSNGLLTNVTPVAGGNRYEWQTNTPIEYYLIAASVAPYSEYKSYMHFTGSTDSMLLQHYLYDTATVRPLFQPAMDSVGYMVDYLSTCYGRYPFWQEKYGHCFAPLGGGMEHQTMTTIGVYDLPLVAHELGHQWWGDAVTYSSWKDIWLSEGWASYTEQLFTEHFRGVAAAKAYRTSVFNRVLGHSGGSVIVDDTTNVLRIFDSRLTYDKGASVAAMLRYTAPDDATFFYALKTYQAQYRNSVASTADFKAVLETAYGHPLDTFFNQWVYGQGYPIYSAAWNQVGSTVYVQLTQTTSVPSSVPLFYTPLEFKLSTATGDTVVKVATGAASQLFSFHYTPTVTDLTIDPNNYVLNSLDDVYQDGALGVKDNVKGAGAVRVAPNPAKGSWRLTGLNLNSILTLYDTGGHAVWMGTAAGTAITVPCESLPAGIYQMVVSEKGGIRTILPLQKL